MKNQVPVVESKKFKIVGYTVISLLALIIGIFIQKNLLNSVPQPISIKSNNTTLTPTNSVTRIYTSSKLGISFNYMNPYASYPVTVTETNNKIEFKVGNVGTSTQTIEVFSKNPSDSLQITVQKQFLTNYPSSDCFPSDERTKHPELSSAYESVEISMPKADNLEQMYNNAKKCPQLYTTTNRVAYFISDKNHPGQYAFFNFGQQPPPMDIASFKFLK